MSTHRRHNNRRRLLLSDIARLTKNTTLWHGAANHCHCLQSTRLVAGTSRESWRVYATPPSVIAHITPIMSNIIAEIGAQRAAYARRSVIYCNSLVRRVSWRARQPRRLDAFTAPAILACHACFIAIGISSICAPLIILISAIRTPVEAKYLMMAFCNNHQRSLKSAVNILS